MAEIWQEELEVLAVIFEDDNFEIKPDQRGFTITVWPEGHSVSEPAPLAVGLNLTITEDYPLQVPDIEILEQEGKLSETERDSLLEKLSESAHGSLGEAMCYTLFTILRQELAQVLIDRKSEQVRIEAAELKAAEEKEKNRPKGTPVTKETFLAWREKFVKDNKLKEAKEQDEKLKALQPKERDELKKTLNKFTGRQLFESNRALVNSDASLLEPDAEELDLSTFEKASGETPPSNPIAT